MIIQTWWKSCKIFRKTLVSKAIYKFHKFLRTSIGKLFLKIQDSDALKNQNLVTFALQIPFQASNLLGGRLVVEIEVYKGNTLNYEFQQLSWS